MWGRSLCFMISSRWMEARAVSAVGSMNSPEKEAEFLRGAGHIIREKEPLRLVVYGKARGLPEIPTLHIPSFTELLHQRLGRTGA